jgi:hypothetical protein
MANFRCHDMIWFGLWCLMPLSTIFEEDFELIAEKSEG